MCEDALCDLKGQAKAGKGMVTPRGVLGLLGIEVLSACGYSVTLDTFNNANISCFKK